MPTSPIPGQQSLIPVNNCILIELSQSFSNVRTKDGKYQAYTEGIALAENSPLEQGVYIPSGNIPSEYGYLVGKRVFFEEYKEGGHIRRGGKEYAFVKLEDVRGYEDV